MNTDISKFTLTPAEKKQFHTDGFIGPFSLPDASDMTSKEPLIRQLLKTSLPDELPEMIRRQAYGSQRGFGRHHDNTLIYSIATDPGIVNRVQGLLGQDLLLWRTMFFSKGPGIRITMAGPLNLLWLYQRGLPLTMSRSRMAVSS